MLKLGTECQMTKGTRKESTLQNTRLEMYTEFGVHFSRTLHCVGGTGRFRESSEPK